MARLCTECLDLPAFRKGLCVPCLDERPADVWDQISSHIEHRAPPFRTIAQRRAGG